MTNLESKTPLKQHKDDESSVNLHANDRVDGAPVNVSPAEKSQSKPDWLVQMAKYKSTSRLHWQISECMANCAKSGESNKT